MKMIMIYLFQDINDNDDDLFILYINDNDDDLIIQGN